MVTLRVIRSAVPSCKISGHDGFLRPQEKMLRAGHVLSEGDVWGTSKASVTACI